MSGESGFQVGEVTKSCPVAGSWLKTNWELTGCLPVPQRDDLLRVAANVKHDAVQCDWDRTDVRGFDNEVRLYDSDAS